MRDNREIIAEYNKLLALTDLALEKAVGHPVPPQRVGKKDLVITHLINRYGYEITVSAMSTIGFC